MYFLKFALICNLLVLNFLYKQSYKLTNLGWQFSKVQFRKKQTEKHRLKKNRQKRDMTMTFKTCYKKENIRVALYNTSTKASKIIFKSVDREGTKILTPAFKIYFFPFFLTNHETWADTLCTDMFEGKEKKEKNK